MRFKSIIIACFLALIWASTAFATITTTYLKSGPYNTDGSTTVFGITFEYLADADIAASIVNTSTGASTTLVFNSDYIVVDGSKLPDGTFTGGTITIQPNAGGNIANGSGQFPSGYQLTIQRGMTLTQSKSYPANGAFPSAATEQALDRLTLLVQQLQNQLNGAIQIPTTDNGINVTLPTYVARENKYLGFDSGGNVTVLPGAGITTISGTSPISVLTSGNSAVVSVGSTIPVSLGGTGQTSLTANALLVGNGTGGVTTLPPSNGSCAIGSGGTWITGSCSGTSNMVLGSTTTANPMISGQANSGLYATTTTAIGVVINGIKTTEWETLASGVDYITLTPGKSGTVPTLAVAGATANQGLNLTATGTGAVKISGIAMPTSVTNNNVVASTASAYINETVSTLLDNGVGSTTGSLLARTSTGWSPLADSTTGFVLTANGSGNLPTYQANTNTSQGLTLLATSDVSSAASVVFNSTYITSTYNKYVIEFDTMSPGSDAVQLQFQISTNNGVSWITSGYLWSANYDSALGGTPGNAVDGGTSQPGILLGGGSSTAGVANQLIGAIGNDANQGRFSFSTPSATTTRFVVSYESSYWGASANGYFINTRGGGTYTVGTGAVNAVRLIMTSGTLSGNFHLYGLKGT